MIYNTPYETTIGRTLNIKGVDNEIRTALVQNHAWMKVNEDNRTILIYPNSLIPKFDHPLLIETARGLKYVATDLSSFVRESATGEITVANRSLFTLQTIRAALTANLIEEGPRNIKSLPGATIKTYSDLITNAISMTLHTNVEDIITLRVLSGWLYLSMLSEQEIIGDLELQAIIAKMSRDLNIPATYIQRYVDGMVYKNIEDFINDVKEKIDNVSLKTLNLGIFYSSVAKNLNSAVWVGLEKQQLLATGIEHIPTFVAILVMCLTEQPFKNAGLTKIALKNFTRDKQLFIMGVNSVVNGR